MSKNDIRELYSRSEKLAVSVQALRKATPEEATPEKAGVVKLDGNTIVANEDGTISAVVDVSKVEGTDVISPTETKPVSSKAVYEAVEEVKVTKSTDLFI